MRLPWSKTRTGPEALHDSTDVANATVRHEPQPPTTMEGWEECLREQITAHPRIALATGLLTGVIAGWWIKR